jgi:recombination associated protein RdgC
LFKNIFVYQLVSAGQALDVESADRHAFTPCGLTTQSSIGWEPPRGNAYDAMLERIGSNIILKATLEKKSVPADIINRELGAIVQRIEDETGRKPGRKETAELRIQVIMDLLPKAFPKRASYPVWIDTEKARVIIGASSAGVADQIVSLMVASFDKISISLVHSTHTPMGVMTGWLDSGDAGESFAIGRQVELKATDESKATVKFSNHHLEAEKMREHMAQGKLPTKLQMSWRDRVSFILTDTMQLKKIEFLDGVMADYGDDDADSGFDADVAISTGELSTLIDDLIQAFGGQAL